MRHPTLPGIVLFAAALALRIWGLSFGLPSFFSGDEVTKRDEALRLVQTHFVHDSRQPSFVYNSLFLIYSAAKAVKPDWTAVDYHYMGRLWMAVLGSLTVVALWRLGSKFDGNDNKIGLASAVLLAVVPLHTACSRYIKEDAPFALMVTLTAWAMVSCLRGPSRKKWMLLGLVGGLTFSTKYAGVVLIAPIALAFVVSARRAKRELGAATLDLAALGSAFALGFFIFSPIYLFHPETFLSGFLFQSRYSMTGHEGIVTDPWQHGWTYYIRNGLIPGMTWPVFLLSVAGLALLARMRDGWIVSVTAVWLYIIFEHARAKPLPFPARYLLPLVPLLCVAAGVALVELAAALKRRIAVPIAYAVCGALFIAPPLLKSLLIADEALHDTRIVAGKWMEENIPPGSTVVVAEDSTGLPVSTFWRTRWRVEDREKSLDASWAGGAPPYFVLGSFKYQRYLDSPDSVPERTAFYRKVMSEFGLVKAFRPRWFTYGKHSPVILIYRPDDGRAPIPGQVPSVEGDTPR
ncbi:MAG TPA: glycosyltransferase family 39 protein [Candidatus Binatia bacterium]